MLLPSLIEYIKLIILREGRMKEAHLSGDRRVPWGCDDHIYDLERRISDAEYWRDKYPRGSEKRARYKGVLDHLKNELKSARRTNQSLNEKDGE